MIRRHSLNLMATLGAGAAAHVQAAETAPARADAVTLSDAEWKRRVAPASYDVLRHEGTERSNTSPLNAEKRAGSYVCAGCEMPLFTVAAKFDSGTGWPSFHTPLAGAIATRTDFKLLLPRTEYYCARCSGHQGHVFDDGPRPTGERHCNDGVALRFAAEAA
jgi:peptide-methionine (R)-S-oxide reductase